MLGTINGGESAQVEVKEVKNYSPPPKQEKQIKKEVKPVLEEIKKTSSTKKSAQVKKFKQAQVTREEEPLILDHIHEEVPVKKNISQKPKEKRIAPLRENG